MKYFIVAGERSGDLHASKLSEQIQKKDVRAEVVGFGGKYMEESGVKVLKHYSSFSFMGFLEVLLNLAKIRRALKDVKREIRTYQPDVLILVDFPGFNLKLASFAKKERIKTCFYISPKIWAWKERRINQIKRDIDKMLVILPFEVDFYRSHAYEVQYVGNPLIDSIKDYSFDQNFSLNGDQINVAVLPGSRKQEILSSTKIIGEIAKTSPKLHFHVAAVDNVEPKIYDGYKSLPNVSVHLDKTYEILKESNVAIVTSGTATLEAALLNCPQVVVYRGHPITIFIAKLLVKIKWISLVNLIANKTIVKELIQENYNPASVLKEINLIVNDQNYCAGMMADYQELRGVIGAERASGKAAQHITEWLLD